MNESAGHPGLASIARTGYQKLTDGDTVGWEQLDPLLASRWPSRSVAVSFKTAAGQRC